MSVIDLDFKVTPGEPEDRSGGNLELLKQPVIAVLGNPEISRRNQNLPRMVWTVKALQQLSDLLLMVKTPGEIEDGRKEEFGFGGIGFLFSREQAQGKETIIVDGWIAADASVPTGVAGKHMTPEFSAQMNREAGTFGEFCIVHGHCHHEVASTDPSGIDYRELTGNPMPAEVIVRRSREPFLVAVHRFDGRRFVNVGGIEIVDNGEPQTSQEDLARLVAQFGYGNSDGSITIIRDDRIESGSVQQMTTIRPGFGSSDGIIQIDEGDVNIGEIIIPPDNIGGEGVVADSPPAKVTIDEVDMAMQELEDHLDKVTVKKVGALQSAWNKISGK